LGEREALRAVSAGFLTVESAIKGRSNARRCRDQFAATESLSYPFARHEFPI
jgi:hypothetical protein